MKNRNSSSAHKLTFKCSDSDVKKTSDKTRRKSAATLFFQKSAQVFQNYSALLKKAPYQFGDPETYFKQTLRNYDDFDFRAFKWETNKSLKQIKSLENCITERRKYSGSPSSLGDGDKRESKTRVLGKYTFKESARSSTRRTDKGEDEETDEFYSPSSHITENFDSVLEENMAEGEEEIVTEDEGDEGAPDPLDETEDLVNKAAEDLDKLEEENYTTELPEDDEEGYTEATGGDATEEEKTEADDFPLSEEAQSDAKKAKDKEKKDARDKDTNAVLKEVEECEKQCMDIYKILNELKQRVSELLSKPSRSEQEDKELQDKQKMLNEKMVLLEQKTKRIEFLVGQSKALRENVYDRPQSEDILPKVIICGVTENSMPKIIVCDGKKKGQGSSRSASRGGTISICDGPPQICPIPPSPPICRGPPPPVCRGPPPTPPPICRGPPPTPPPICRGPPPHVCGRPPPICELPICAQPNDTSVVPQFAKRLCESYNMQERLAAENADLEGKRYKLQEDLISQDQTVESLQRKLASLQGEMRMIVKENNLLNDKLEKNKCPPPPICNRGDSPRARPPGPCSKPKKMPCPKGKGGICPADVQGRLDEYSETTQQLEKQLADMEDEVRNMQTELVAVRQERMHLEQHRRMLMAPPCAPAPCGTPCGGPCGPPPCGSPPCGPPCGPPCAPKPPCPGPCNPNRGISADQQLRELREQYYTLQDDYKGKLVEVASLRADVEKLKQNAKDAEEAKKLAEEKSKECERLLKEFKNEKTKLTGIKEQLIEVEQQLNVAKQRYREAKDELEEVRALVEDQQSQLDDYRNKYLQAQQQVEEQRRQIDMMELENGRISEQVNLEIQRVKNQFQEKLQELTPLPDILKATQLKLQEAQQMHLLAERNNEGLVRELQSYRDKAAALAEEMEKAKTDQQLGAGEKASLIARAEEWENKCNELSEENDRLKTDLLRLEEISDENEKRAQEKMHEIAQLMAEVENVREEAARQVARTKDRCETVRRSMQNQIADMERQLAQSRAQARAAQKDRDEIRQKMQAQINNLNENFEDAQMRIRNLQGHVNFLKNSYTNVFPSQEQNVNGVPEGMDPCNCGNNY